MQDDRGSTALHMAAHFGHIDIVNYLVENNADLNIKNEQNRTPIDIKNKWNT